MIKENTPIIETERLILRKFKKSDIDAFFKIDFFPILYILF